MHDVITVVRTEVLQRLKCFRRDECFSTKKKNDDCVFLLFPSLAPSLRLFISSILRKSPYGKFLMIGR